MIGSEKRNLIAVSVTKRNTDLITRVFGGRTTCCYNSRVRTACHTLDFRTKKKKEKKKEQQSFD